MAVYSECVACGFVLRAASETDPQPKHWDECPDCGEDTFEFASGELFTA